MAATEESVPVRFFTRVAAVRVEGLGVCSVPTWAGRKRLSAIINHLLGTSGEQLCVIYLSACVFVMNRFHFSTLTDRRHSDAV